MPPLSRLRAEWPSGVPSDLMLEYYNRPNKRKDSMYYQVISQCVQMLKNLESWLDKAEEHAAAKKFDVGVLMAGRLALGTDAAQARGQRAYNRRGARPHPEDRRFRGERERGPVCGSQRAQGQHVMGACRQGPWRGRLSSADVHPQYLLPRRDGLCRPPPQWSLYRQDGLPRPSQLDRRLIGARPRCPSRQGLLSSPARAASR